MSVVDASVWISRLLSSDAHHLPSIHWLRVEVARGTRLVAPTLLLAEVAGALSRRTGRQSEAWRAINQILAIPVLSLIPLDGEMVVRASRIAADLGIRGADAVYVAAAEHLGMPLVTWDADQRRRAATLIAARTPLDTANGV